MYYNKGKSEDHCITIQIQKIVDTKKRRRKKYECFGGLSPCGLFMLGSLS